MFARCPKCGHQPLPADQSLPAACAGCGAILAKLAQLQAERQAMSHGAERRAGTDVGIRRSRHAAHGAAGLLAPGGQALDGDTPAGWRALILHVPPRVDSQLWWGRAALWAAFVAWGLWLMTLSVAEGGIGSSFIHRPLLVFHEAGHVLFMPFGHWLMVAGGTLLQWIVPAVLLGALLWKNRDPFGASFGMWLLGVSVMDTAPYVYDALHPQLMLLSGSTGEEGGHDFIFLLESLGLRPRAQTLGLLLHKLGALVTLLAMAWGGWLLMLQHRQRAGLVLHE